MSKKNESMDEIMKELEKLSGKYSEEDMVPPPKEEQTTVEFGGMSFTGGKAVALVTALSTLGGGAWAGFEIYADYMNMKEIVQNIDVDEIKASNQLVITKMEENMVRIEEAIEYTRDIKTGLRDDILGIEKQADRVEDMVRESEDKVRDMIDKASERFESKRDQLSSDTTRDMKELESRLMNKLQLALDNPLSDQ